MHVSTDRGSRLRSMPNLLAQLKERLHRHRSEAQNKEDLA